MTGFTDRFTALLDACVPGGALKRNFLRSPAEAGIFSPGWTVRTLDETQRAITEITNGEVDEEKLNLPDSNDNHVLPAARFDAMS